MSALTCDRRCPEHQQEERQGSKETQFIKDWWFPRLERHHVAAYCLALRVADSESGGQRPTNPDLLHIKRIEILQ
jgi:hypothetical protein